MDLKNEAVQKKLCNFNIEIQKEIELFENEQLKTLYEAKSTILKNYLDN